MSGLNELSSLLQRQHIVIAFTFSFAIDHRTMKTEVPVRSPDT